MSKLGEGITSIASDGRVSVPINVSSSPSRWPDIPRYYGRAWVRWAVCADLQRYAYTGVDAFGELQRVQGRLWRRWSDTRRRQNLALIYSFSEILPENSRIWFLTLTVRHPKKHTYIGQKRAIEDIRDAWALFRVWMRKMIPNCRYLRYIEAGSENGYAHIHMILCYPNDENYEKITKHVSRIPDVWCRCCRKIGNDALPKSQNIQDIGSESEIQNVGAYISKYLSKTLETEKSVENTDFWRWMEVCYRMRLRTVSMDAESRQYVRKKYEKLEDIAKIEGVYGEFMILDPCLESDWDNQGIPLAAWEMFALKHHIWSRLSGG